MVSSASAESICGIDIMTATANALDARRWKNIFGDIQESSSYAGITRVRF
jgi:hypothetical protein